MGRVITLTTDFGATDAFVGIMKGVVLCINPEASIVDLCHGIEPQNVLQAAFVLGAAYRYFPESAIHVVVVDPGVGSERRMIILKTPRFLFVAPDNGVLSYVVAEATPPGGVRSGELGAGVEAVTISNPRFWLKPVSATFHGRDIFAPVAAYLSLGAPLREFGESVSSIVARPPSRPEFRADGTILGHVIHIDRFGNLITDMKGENVVRAKVRVEVGGRLIEGLSPSYAEGGELLALVGSSGYLEVASRNGSAAVALSAKVGDLVIVAPAR